MPWTLSLLQPERIVLTEYLAPMTGGEVMTATRETVAFAREHEVCRFLSDCTRFAQVGTPFEVFELIRLYEVLQLPPGMRDAVLLPKSDQAREDMRFYETASRNRGYDVRLFVDRQAAIDWLIR